MRPKSVCWRKVFATAAMRKLRESASAMGREHDALSPLDISSLDTDKRWSTNSQVQ